MTGALSISFDFEAGWGVVGNGAWRMREQAGIYRDLRPALKRFVALLDDLELACIWVPVGAMIDDPSARDLSYLRGAFGAKVAAALNEAAQETLEGRDLLDTVQAARCTQHFGTHSYSHLLFTDPEQGADVIATDLDLARQANARAGIAAEFLVFPENRFGHFETVVQSGITHVRMPAANQKLAHHPQHPGQASKLRRMAQAVLQPPSPAQDAIHPTGLSLHHGTALLNWGVGAGLAKRVITRRRLTRALAMAAGGANVHLWLHPFNLVQTPGLYDFVSGYLKDVARHRDAGRLVMRGVL